MSATRHLGGRPRPGTPRTAIRHPGIRFALALALLVPAAGCGSSVGSTPDPKAAEATTTTATEASPGEPGALGSEAPGEGGDATPSPEGPTADVGAAEATGGDDEFGGGPVFDRTGELLPLGATFASKCVLPGGPQTITIRSAPDVEVIYHATYSDKRTARDPGYHGGNNIGTTNDEGVWKDTWQIEVTAPPGRVRVDVVASSWEAFAHIETEFAVAGPFGLCP